MPEKLNELELIRAITKPLTYKPSYNVAEKRIFAWSIVWEGSISITQHTYPNRVTYQPTIELRNTEFATLETFHTKIAKLGTISKIKYGKPKDKPTKAWEVKSLEEVAFLLEKVAPHIKSKRKSKVAYLVLEFCRSRIKKWEKATREHKRVEPYSQREHDIVKQVSKLNERGRKQ